MARLENWGRQTKLTQNRITEWSPCVLALFAECKTSIKYYKRDCLAGMGSNGVTVTKFLMTLELCLELSYILSQLFIVVTVTEVT